MVNMIPPEEKFYKLLGELINQKRRTANKSQDELAKLVGLFRTSITNIEAGRQKIRLYTLYQIAAALEIPINNLLPDVEGGPEDLLSLLNSKKILADSGQSTSLSQEEKERVLKVIKDKH